MNNCPVCNSSKIIGGNIDNEDGECWQEVECESCKSSWQEVYNFSHIENLKKVK